MGIAFVLIIGGIVGLVLAVIGSAVGAGITAILLRKHPAVRARYLPKIVLFIFLCLPYFGVAFIVYSLWCTTIRGVDFGIGDTWNVRLENGYELVAIDSFEYPFISHGDTTVVDGITGIAQSHDVLLLKTGKTDRDQPGEHRDPFILLNMATSITEPYTTESALRAAATRHGTAAFQWEAPEMFYTKRRWGVLDLLAVLLILTVPVWVAWRGVLSMRKMLQGE